MAIDNFRHNKDDVFMTSREPYEVTPHNTDPLPTLPKALLMGAAGDVVFRGIDSSADITMTVEAGFYLLVQAQYVRATGTTVSQIIALP